MSSLPAPSVAVEDSGKTKDEAGDVVEASVELA